MDLALKNLKDFKEVADKLGIRFMLQEGTLLGAYRDKGFVKDDENDIDLGIMDDQFHRVEELIERLEEKGFLFHKGFYVNGKFQGGALVKGDSHIDIMRMLLDGDEIINYGEAGKIKYIYPKEIFNGYSKIDFYGVEYDAPKDIEGFLSTRYGDWKTPVGKEEYSYKDPKYSPNVR